jgi:putative DNA primase/helicase
MQNGTLEFIGAGVVFREHRKEDMCSFIGGCEYRPEIPVPDIWTRHVSLIASVDPDLVKTMQTMFGYCLEGGNALEKIGIATGAGRNGKSVTFRTYSRILGGYAVNVNPLTLMQDGNKTTSPERLKMRNARLIVAQEPNKQSDDQHHKDTSVLDSGFLKAASGKGTISARGLYSNTIEEFTVTGLICLSTNPLPAVNDRSVAFWDRILILPFDHYFRIEERDPKIEEKFNAVLPGILNWFVDGWKAYHETGTIPISIVSQVVLDEYRNADDEYAAFVSCCIEDIKGAETPADDLYAEYESWSKSRHQMVKPVQLFGRDMATRFSKKRKKTGIIYCDIRIRTGQQQVSA